MQNKGITLSSILTSREAGFDSLANLASWLRMEAPPSTLRSFHPVGYPSFFGLFFFLSDRFVPFVVMALGHRTAPLGPPKYEKKKQTNGFFVVTD